MAIRLATTNDADAVRELVRCAYEKYVARIGRPPKPMTVDYSALIDDGVVRVLIQDSNLIGVLVLLDQPDHLLLDNVAVDPSHQGKGFGKVLLAFAEQEARRRSYDTVRLYTNALMTENIALYRSLGYRETYHADKDGYRRGCAFNLEIIEAAQRFRRRADIDRDALPTAGAQAPQRRCRDAGRRQGRCTGSADTERRRNQRIGARDRSRIRL